VGRMMRRKRTKGFVSIVTKMTAGNAEVEVQQVAACWPILAGIGSLSVPISVVA
jgi:hypothetical protein